MPWPKDHKSRTRERIVRSAAAAFRAGGIDGVRVEDVMARAGLTHGGFYAHFASKDDLLDESVTEASRETVAMLSKALDAAPGGDRFRAMVDAYLSPMHVAHPEVGCPLATLGPEIVRAGGPTQRNLGASVKARLEWMRQQLPDEQRDAAADGDLIGALACMVGGLILARAVGPKDSAAVLDACREFVNGQVKGRRKREEGKGKNEKGKR